jgi:hypothetical protein
LKYSREETQPLQEAMLLAEHVATRHTQTTKGIVDMDQGSKTLSTQKSKASQKPRLVFLIGR